jgi:RHS repeat-associated protein
MSPKLWHVHADHLDRPLRMTDGTQAVVWDAVYRPFGEVVSITGSGSNNLRFPGQYFLIESGLHYNWHRHYDPTIGRYLQTDPLGFVDGPSIYNYARANPTLRIDPDGNFSGPLMPQVVPLLRPFPRLYPPAPGMGPQGPSSPFLAPQDKDPCAGLRKQLQEHEQKLENYIKNPGKYDNKGFLGQSPEIDKKVFDGRVRNLQRQID